MIEHVLRIGTELDIDALPPRNRERLGSGQIESVDSGPIEAVPSHVAEGSVGRLSECRWVKPVEDAAVGWIQTNAGVPIWKLRARLRVGVLIPIYAEGVSGLEHNGAGNLPAANCLVEHPAAIEELLASAERQLIYRIAFEGMADVEVGVAVTCPGVIYT